jgi:transposase
VSKRDSVVPKRVDEYIADNNPVRFIDAYVESLDLVALGFTRAVPKGTGRPGYTPADLLKLYIYGYLQKIRSSRK